jgi:conjugative transfer signal peptidase TraF
MVLGVGALCAAAWAKPSARLVYNRSNSAPPGWYLVVSATDLRTGDYVLARLPSDTAALAAVRDYLPRSVPILKQIAAVAGQRVCVRNGVVYIDGAPLARTLEADDKNRPLTTWTHCRPLLKDELFLLNPANPASFDSRYFGPIDASFVRGRAIPLWTSDLQ